MSKVLVEHIDPHRQVLDDMIQIVDDHYDAKPPAGPSVASDQSSTTLFSYDGAQLAEWTGSADIKDAGTIIWDWLDVLICILLLLFCGMSWWVFCRCCCRYRQRDVELKMNQATENEEEEEEESAPSNVFGEAAEEDTGVDSEDANRGGSEETSSWLAAESQDRTELVVNEVATATTTATTTTMEEEDETPTAKPSPADRLRSLVLEMNKTRHAAQEERATQTPETATNPAIQSQEANEVTPISSTKLAGTKRKLQDDFEKAVSPDAKRSNAPDPLAKGEYVRVRVGTDEEAVAIKVNPQPRLPDGFANVVLIAWQGNFAQELVLESDILGPVPVTPQKDEMEEDDVTDSPAGDDKMDEDDDSKMEATSTEKQTNATEAEAMDIVEEASEDAKPAADESKEYGKGTKDSSNKSTRKRPVVQKTIEFFQRFKKAASPSNDAKQPSNKGPAEEVSREMEVDTPETDKLAADLSEMKSDIVDLTASGSDVSEASFAAKKVSSVVVLTNESDAMDIEPKSSVSSNAKPRGSLKTTGLVDLDKEEESLDESPTPARPTISVDEPSLDHSEKKKGATSTKSDSTLLETVDEYEAMDQSVMNIGKSILDSLQNPTSDIAKSAVRIMDCLNEPSGEEVTADAYNYAAKKTGSKKEEPIDKAITQSILSPNDSIVDDSANLEEDEEEKRKLQNRLRDRMRAARDYNI